MSGSPDPASPAAQGGDAPGDVEHHARAADELERACDFKGAARQALLAGDPRRAAMLAALAGDGDLAAEAVERAAAVLSREVALRGAEELAARGFGRHAGALFAKLGAHLEAAQAYASAGEAVLAARCFDRAGRPADGARALDAALRLRPTDGAASLELGRLLARHQRTEAAVKALQQIPTASPERAKALPLLRRLLGALGLDEAAHTVALEARRLGVSETDEGPSEDDERVAASAPTVASMILGRYERVREVAVTPHARVIEAVDCVGGARVAIKLLAGQTDGAGRDALLRFEREARALAQIRHPNVLPLVAYHPEGPAIVLPWMPGGSLADRLRKEPMAPARAVEIVCAVLAALGEAHRLGILHRDVKPSNVLFDEVGTPRLADFGAAHLGDLSTTATAGAIGTFAYMSPEQRLGKPATLASDLYSAGVLLSELLTGAPAGPAVSERLEAPLGLANPELGEAHEAVVARLLQEEPRRRPADAFEARRLIGALAWPTETRQLARLSDRPRVSERPPADGRLGPAFDAGDGRDLEARQHDAWLDRDVIVLALDEERLSRVRAFARAGHPALPTVLRVDPATNTVWIAAPRGRALADEPRGLSPGQLARLREAIEALQAASGAHGCIDAEHLYVEAGEVTLAFPRRAPEGDLAARDADALAALEGSAGLR